jgi:hypothetical protein
MAANPVNEHSGVGNPPVPLTPIHLRVTVGPGRAQVLRFPDHASLSVGSRSLFDASVEEIVAEVVLESAAVGVYRRAVDDRTRDGRPGLETSRPRPAQEAMISSPPPLKTVVWLAVLT